MYIEVKVIIPKNIFLTDDMIAEIERIQRVKSAPDVIKMFKSTTEGWDGKPGFLKSHGKTATSIYSKIYPGGTYAWKYNLVNIGSPPHTIPKSGTALMRFKPGYRASTSPRILSSRAKQRFGYYISTTRVDHPGFPGREFDAEIAKQYQPIFERDMNAAIQKTANKSANQKSQ
ncbi:MAG: hypothetical protein WC734_06510 [Patescibacteria group bacterium]|jgi:hypothetical protein